MIHFYNCFLFVLAPHYLNKTKQDPERGWRRKGSKWSFQPQSMRKLKPSM
ncbi:hypothetical protein RchiOBHm_Chr1g0378711 [Rosa chinensis]|uniref:Uncharacterized protein n=1 Tax=Rosa chinensis TaxID=74649 RepID=A0A2P6SNJ5_ROSCH|nr:hypothetical protein RchiOBHm_Chr1g0378711 [Rosa chinensis]